MQFTRVVSFLVVFVTFGLVALAAPATEKRAGTDILTVISTAQDKANTILPQISEYRWLIKFHNVLTEPRASEAAGSDQAKIAPLLSELVIAFEAAEAVFAVEGAVIVTGFTVAEVAGALSVLIHVGPLQLDCLL